MELTSNNTIAEILEKHKAELLADWLKELQNSGLRRDDLMRAKELRSECQEFLQLLQIALQQGNFSDIQTPEWENMRLMLAEVSRSRVLRGFTPSEIASFILCFKKPLFDRLCHSLTQNRDALVEQLWLSTSLLDQLGLWVTEIFLKAREEVIERQQQEMLELSTPVVKLWQGILALPMIGTLDSARTQIVMETLLQEIMETGSEFAILDITGVPTVDTLVAQHLLKTVAAARLMGTECIISGIRPQIAQTIVHLGVDLQDILTKATLADAFKVALQRQGLTIKNIKEER
ncbi:anti-anti-sigma factor [filamentous cyanobacterium Phorm 46]|nr:anti-anti-sigma factor [filamentous cyanobacterium Phorm 46]